MVGAFVETVPVYLYYMKHFDVMQDADGKLPTCRTVLNIR